MMKRIATTLTLLPLIIGSLTSNLLAMPSMNHPQHSNIRAASAECTSIGKQVAEEQGGRLSRVTPIVQNGKAVCVIVVIIPAKDGERPRRVEVAAPL